MWIDVKNYEEYYKINSLGDVYSKRIGKIMKQQLLPNGYLKIGLNKNKKQTTYLVHRLVAEMFLGLDTSNKSLIIDHIDNNKTNNNVDNLRILDSRLNNVRSMEQETYMGVHKIKNRYYVSCRINGTLNYIGSYKNKDIASLKYIEFLSKHYNGNFPKDFLTITKNKLSPIAIDFINKINHKRIKRILLEMKSEDE